MNSSGMLETIRENAKHYYAERAAAELAYARQVSLANGGIHDETVNGAIDYLYSFLRKNGAITNEAAETCEKMLAPVSPDAKKLRLICVSHAHIDMNWMWGFNETVAVTLDTFRTVLKLMEQYPQFTFSQSQASTYRIAEEYDPELFERIRQRVAEGRWEVTASTWVEADKNMPRGESLARHILYTKNYLREKFGPAAGAAAIDFEPDTFGHSACVPEILSRGRVKYYYHCRGSEESHIFNWRVPSGAEILAYREPFWYNASITPDFIEPYPEFCKKYGIDFALKVYGIGDHGGGPTRRDVERLTDMAGWPVAPSIEFGRYDTFFAELEKHARRFPVVEGELNYIFTGCYSSQSRIKQANKAAETQLLSAEAATAVSSCFASGAESSGIYKKAWEKTLFNQFHDIITGSGVRSTREFALGRFQEAVGGAYAGRAKALSEIANRIDTSSVAPEDAGFSFSEGGGVGFSGSSDSNSAHIGGFNVLFPERGGGKKRILHLFNPTGYDREETFEITVWDYPGKIEKLRIRTPRGSDVPFRVSESGDYWAHRFHKILVYVRAPQFGYTTLLLGEGDKENGAAARQEDPRVETYPENVLENDLVRAEFDGSMMLTKLTDKTAGRSPVKAKSAFFVLEEQNHTSGTVMNGNAWVEGFPVKTACLNESFPVFIGERTASPLRQSIRYTIPFRNSRLDVTVFLDRGSPVLHYSVRCDWHEIFSQTAGIPSLKFIVPLGYGAEKYRYQIPFGSIERGPLNHDVPSTGFAFAPGAEDGRGVALLSDSGYAFRGENDTLSATLLRASQEPDEYPEYGLHTHSLGVAPCGAGLNELFRLSSLFAFPFVCFSNSSHSGNLPLEGSFIQPEGSIEAAAVKTPEDRGGGLVIRLFDTSGKGTQASVTFGRTVASAAAVDLTESPAGKPVCVDGKKVSFTLAPGEILTLKIAFA